MQLCQKLGIIQKKKNASKIEVIKTLFEQKCTPKLQFLIENKNHNDSNEAAKLCKASNDDFNPGGLLIL